MAATSSRQLTSRGQARHTDCRAVSAARSAELAASAATSAAVPATGVAPVAGSSGHPGGAISGGAGYITAGIIARDLGAKLWWRPADAATALGAIARAA